MLFKLLLGLFITKLALCNIAYVQEGINGYPSKGIGPWDWTEEERADPENKVTLDRLGNEFKENEKIIADPELLNEYRLRKRQASLRLLHEIREKQMKTYPKGDYPEVLYVGDDYDWSKIS